MTIVEHIEEEDNCTAYYFCDNGKVYYDDMYTFDVCEGDEIDGSDYDDVSHLFKKK